MSVNNPSALIVRIGWETVWFRAGAWGFLLNLPWEWAHSVLYWEPRGYTLLQHLGCCLVAAAMDGAAITSIYPAGRLVFKDSDWFRERGWTGLALTLVLGAAGAGIMEKAALALGWWSYSPAMPRVLSEDLGLTPLLQFLMLPPLVFCLLSPPPTSSSPSARQEVDSGSQETDIRESG